MTDKKAMKMALDALSMEYSRVRKSFTDYMLYRKKVETAIEALRTALAQPELEPVAVWELQEGGWDTIADADWMETLPIGTKLYTAPPKKEWVGLTDDEIRAILDCGRGGVVDIKKAEQKLKDKNNG